MPTIDPTSNIGKVRLRVGDFLDLVIFPDSVYQSVLDDCDSNVVQASKLMAQYILAALSMRVHEKMGQLEVYGNGYAANYIAFLKTTILNPHFMELAPIPYGGADVEDGTVHPLIKFQQDWNLNYASGTQSEQMANTAIGGSTNGSTYGF